MAESNNFDLIVVGAGPGGCTAARYAAGLGLRTALIEREAQPGGTSVRHGCLPVGVWRRAAAATGTRARALDWADLQAGAVELKVAAARRAESQLLAAGVTIQRGTARLDGPTVVRLTGGAAGETLTSSRIILATGSVPAGLPGVVLDGRHLLNTDHLLACRERPASLVVVGGGRIGVELAGLMQAFGSEATLVEVNGQILPGQDAECTAALTAFLRRAGLTIHTGTRARQIAPEGRGIRCVLADRSGGGSAEIRATHLVAATGRRARTADLGLESVAVVRDRRGRIQVDSAMQTATAGLYAIGDIVPTPRLAQVACREALVAVAHASGRSVTPVRHQHVPFAVRGLWDLASVGLTAEAAAEAGHLVRRARFPLAGADEAGFISLVADTETGGLLGVHMVGANVAALLPAAVAALGGAADEPGWSAIVPAAPPPSAAMSAALARALGALSRKEDHVG